MASHRRSGTLGRILDEKRELQREVSRLKFILGRVKEYAIMGYPINMDAIEEALESQENEK